MPKPFAIYHEHPDWFRPLFAELETLPGVGPKAAQAFEMLGVVRPKDLLYLLRRYAKAAKKGDAFARAYMKSKNLTEN